MTPLKVEIEHHTTIQQHKELPRLLTIIIFIIFLPVFIKFQSVSCVFSLIYPNLSYYFDNFLNQLL